MGETLYFGGQLLLVGSLIFFAVRGIMAMFRKSLAKAARKRRPELERLGALERSTENIAANLDEIARLHGA